MNKKRNAGFSYVSLALVLACIAGMAVVAVPQYSKKQRDAWDDLRDAGVKAGIRACRMYKTQAEHDDNLEFTCAGAATLLRLPDGLRVTMEPAVSAEFKGETNVLETVVGCRISSTVDSLEGSETSFYKFSDSLPMPAE